MAVTFNYNQKKLSLVDVLSHLEPDEYSRDEIPVLVSRLVNLLPKLTGYCY